MSTNIGNLITPYAYAGYPALALETVEEARVLAALLDWQPGQPPAPRPVYSIAAAGGLRDERPKTDREGKTIDPCIDPTCSYGKAFALASQMPTSVLIVYDWHHVCRSASQYRPLLQVLGQAKARGTIFVFVAPRWDLPEELRHEMRVLNIPLPTAAELAPALEIATEGAGVELPPERATELCNAARGLTHAEAEASFSFAALNIKGREQFSARVVESEKMRLVRSAAMSVENAADPASLAGLDNLKEYITGEVIPSLTLAPSLRVKGVLLVGVPGTGKSLAARVMAALLHRPLIRFSLDAVMAGIVGESERNMREALDTADAIAPCLLFVDEIEKGFGGYNSARSDGGATLKVMSRFLTWSQDHTSDVVVVATCNDFAKLPPEMTRAGRFDERFFVDLPPKHERIAIATVHLAAHQCNAALADHIADLTHDWTGAEIEQLVKSAARRTRQDVTQDALTARAADIVPISRSTAIQELREWAKHNFRLANGSDPTLTPELLAHQHQAGPAPTGRKIMTAEVAA